MLRIAAEQAPDPTQAGVYLSEEATFYTILGLGTESLAVSAGDTPLPAGTRVMVLSADEVPLPGEPDAILRQVQVFFKFDGTDGADGGVEFDGWLRQDVLERAIPVVPHVFVTGDESVNVRAGDSIRHATRGALPPGDSAPLLARNPATTWYKIGLAGNRVGWVSAALVIALGRAEDLASLPVESPPPPPPTATFTPFVPPTQVPTSPADAEQPPSPPTQPPAQPPSPPAPTLTEPPPSPTEEAPPAEEPPTTEPSGDQGN